MEERNRVILETVRDMLAREDVPQAVTTVEGLHSPDAAEVLSRLGLLDEARVISAMDAKSAARALLEMEDDHQVALADKLKSEELTGIIDSMPLDEAADLLGDIPEERRSQLLRLFAPDRADELAGLLVYHDTTAGGLMTPDYISVSERATVEETIESLRAVDPDVETIYYVYVVTDDGTLGGVLSLREMIVSPPNRLVEQIMSTDLITVPPEMDQEEVAELISKYNLLAVPVVEPSGAMLGIVTVDDVMEVIGDEAEEDIMRFAGAAAPEEREGGLWANIGRRLPWFFVVIVIELLVAGGLLKLYTPTLEKVVVLVFFIPLLVTMGGNIAIQSSTVMAHSVDTGKLRSMEIVKGVGGEVGWGVLVGVITGGVVAGFSYALNLGASVGLVVGLSLALTVIAASMVGCALPIALGAAGRDPAAASSPMVGTLMDVLSLAIYLGIGRLLI
jgi:magnesium transporter